MNWRERARERSTRLVIGIILSKNYPPSHSIICSFEHSFVAMCRLKCLAFQKSSHNGTTRVRQHQCLVHTIGLRWRIAVAQLNAQLQKGKGWGTKRWKVIFETHTSMFPYCFRLNDYYIIDLILKPFLDATHTLTVESLMCQSHQRKFQSIAHSLSRFFHEVTHSKFIKFIRITPIRWFINRCTEL